MKYFKFIFFLVLIFFSCQKYPEYGGNFEKTIEVDGQKREYILHLPIGFNKIQEDKLPLLIVLHGGGGNPNQIMRSTDFNKIANSHKFIVLYPAGLNKKWADARNTTESSVAGIDDVEFIRQLIDTINTHYNIDENRIFVTGISNGGMMIQTLLCALPEVFAAGASVVANLPENLSDSLPQNKVACMYILGTDDPLVPFEGGEMQAPTSGGFILSANESAKLWAISNLCDTIPDKTELPDLKNDETTITLFDYQNGEKDVKLYVVNNGGHCWPRGSNILPESIVGKRTKDIDATEIIWNFFNENQK